MAIVTGWVVYWRDKCWMQSGLLRIGEKSPSKAEKSVIINLVVQCKSQSVGQWFIFSDLEIHISCVFVFLRVQNIIFDVLEPLPFQKYSTCWVFPALHHSVFVYLCLCICVIVSLYLCICVFYCPEYHFDVLGSLAFQKYKYM